MHFDYQQIIRGKCIRLIILVNISLIHLNYKLKFAMQIITKHIRIRSPNQETVNK